MISLVLWKYIFLSVCFNILNILLFTNNVLCIFNSHISPMAFKKKTLCDMVTMSSCTLKLRNSGTKTLLLFFLMMNQIFKQLCI